MTRVTNDDHKSCLKRVRETSNEEKTRLVETQLIKTSNYLELKSIIKTSNLLSTVITVTDTWFCNSDWAISIFNETYQPRVVETRRELRQGLSFCQQKLQVSIFLKYMIKIRLNLT